MIKEVLEEEKQYLINVENEISRKINVLDGFLQTEKLEIQKDKFAARATGQTKVDADDAFLDAYLRNQDLEEKQAEYVKLKRMQKNPYFARVDVKENKGTGYYNYIGYRSLSKPNNNFYVIDWRAPFSSLFYDFDKGPFKYKTISGEVNGEILNKRQIKIENGEFKFYFDSDLKVDDDVLQQTLSKSTSEKMKNIVATIQREQNQIIRCSEKKNTLVMGVAGSGKTSIALHRVAYLLYKLKGELKSSEILILSPNEMFSSYISEVLPELNEDNALNTTFEEIIRNELGSELEFETRQQQVERKISGKFDVDEFKNSYEYFIHLYNFALNFANKQFKANNIRIGEFNITESKINNLYRKNFINYLPFKRIEWIIDNLIENYFASYTKLEFKIQDFLHARLYRMFSNNNPINIYKKFLSEQNKKFSLIGKKIKHEDILGILFINYILYGSINYSNYKHVVIDEAQDYNAIQFYLIDSYFNCPKTIVGDVGQALDSKSAAHCINNLDNIFGVSNANFKIVDTSQIICDEIIKLKLNKSYRSSYEITTLCNSILNRTDCEPIKRKSEKPQIIKLKSKQQFINVVGKLIEKYKSCGYNNIGIITKNNKSAQDVYELLHKNYGEIKLASDINNHLNGIVVLPAFNAKGLEFDAVIIYNVNSENFNSELDQQLLYVASTRALHNLTLLFTKQRTKFLDNYFTKSEDNHD